MTETTEPTVKAIDLEKLGAEIGGALQKLIDSVYDAARTIDDTLTEAFKSENE